MVHQVKDRVIEVKTEKQFQELVKNCENSAVFVLNFWASWAEPCEQMNQIFDELANKFTKTLHFMKVEAEEVVELSEKFDISSVPSFIFYKADDSVLDVVEGANAPELTKLTESYAKKVSMSNPALPISTPIGGDTDQDAELDMNSRLKKLTTLGDIVLFMKGTPLEPRCGFSRQMVTLLDDIGVEYKYFDILSDEEVRQALKQFANWPTYPQLWVKGELIGGLDICREMIDSGELQEML